MEIDIVNAFEYTILIRLFLSINTNGRPKSSWRRSAEQELRQIGLRWTQIERQAQDRERWKKTVDEPLFHLGAKRLYTNDNQNIYIYHICLVYCVCNVCVCNLKCMSHFFYIETNALYNMNCSLNWT